MMKRINRNNYESYLIDWMEGNLDARTGEELMLFLDNNPDIKEELEEFENIFLEPEPVTLPNKSTLKKNSIIPTGNIYEDNYETFFIARHEKDLSPKEQIDVEEFVLANPSLKRELELFDSLTVSPDESIVYDNKEELYHHKKVIPLFWLSSTAAILLVLIAIFGLLKNSSTRQILPNHGQVVSQVSKPIKNDATLKHDRPQAKNSSSVAVNKTLAKAPAEINHDSNRETTPLVTGAKPRRASRQYASLIEIAPANAGIKLTSDEIYCKFKYKRHRDDVSLQNPVKRKTFVGKILAGLIKDAKEKANPMIPKNSDEPLLAKVLDGGAHVLNNYTGTEVSVTKYYDNRGNLVAYHFSGGQISINKKFNPQGR